MRTYDVLVEETVQGWVMVEAEDYDDAQRRILSTAIKVPRQRVTRWAPRRLAREPIVKHGRVFVREAIVQCGGANPITGERDVLLKLDCGHDVAYVPESLWFPDNPWCECRNTECTTRQAVAA